MGPSPFRIARRKNRPAFHDRSRQGMGNRPDRRHRHSRQRPFQSQISPRKTHEQRRHSARRRSRRRKIARALQLQHDLLRLSHVLDAHLLRLPFANDGQRPPPNVAQRRPDDANYTSYNFQVLRDDIYMLGVDGTVTGHRIAPARSSCAILVSSQNANREWIYYQQQTISASGFSGQAYSTFVPHTVRAKETKQCSDCHVSEKNDNNAWMAQLLLQGTNFMNFMGRYVYVATGKKGFEAVAVAEHDEPEAIYGSDLHRIAYPDDYKKFVKRGRGLTTSYEHDGDVLDIQVRGEYAYAAMGKDGLRVFDIANVDNKGFSERITSAPVSPLGQQFYVPTKNAQAVASPTTLGVDPLRKQLP